jgi:uncharacterized protein (DUF2141 family)
MIFSPQGGIMIITKLLTPLFISSLLLGCGSEYLEGDESIPAKKPTTEGLNATEKQSAIAEEKEPVTILAIALNKLVNKKGDICFGVFKGSAGYPDTDKAVFDDCVPANSDSGPTIELEPNTSYGIAFFHDENRNGKLDTRGIGPVQAPVEGYGFSRNPGFKPGSPDYSEIQFVTKGEFQTISVDFIYLFK